VQFANKKSADEAMKKHKERIGHRYANKFDCFVFKCNLSNSLKYIVFNSLKTFTKDFTLFECIFQRNCFDFFGNIIGAILLMLGTGC
jgi:hypothetical protein